MHGTIQRDRQTEQLFASLERDHSRLEDYIGVLDVVLAEETHDAFGFKDALRTLIGEVEKHFRKEEAWMKRIAYPGAAGHTDQHIMLVAALKDFRRGYESNPTRPNAYVIRSFIDDWLVDHMENADKIIETYASARAAGLTVG